MEEGMNTEEEMNTEEVDKMMIAGMNTASKVETAMRTMAMVGKTSCQITWRLFFCLQIEIRLR